MDKRIFFISVCMRNQIPMHIGTTCRPKIAIRVTLGLSFSCDLVGSDSQYDNGTNSDKLDVS